MNKLDKDTVTFATMKEVPPSKIMPTKSIRTSEDVEDLRIVNNPFWFNHNNGEQYSAYKKGILTGAYSEARCNNGTLFELFYTVFKTALRETAEREEHQLSDYDIQLKLMKNLFDLLEDMVDNTLTSEIFGEELLAYMYGAIIGYITKNSKE